MRRRTLLRPASSGGAADGSTATPLDICFYNSQKDQLEIVTNEQWNAGKTTKYPAGTYTPIGVVVVPGTHGVLKDKDGNAQCGVISLKEMNYSTPDTGSTSYQYMYWGGYGTDISTLTNYNKVVTASSTTANNANSNATTGYLPLNGSYSSSSYIPSPYKNSDLKSGDFNTAYSDVNKGTSANALSDFDGPGNTKILTDLATAQSGWKTASTITNNSGANYYPAACCCWRYHTAGTQQGDWYLPACGELGYIIPNFSLLNDAIGALIDAYGNSVGVRLDSNYYYWSSSEYSSNFARYVSTNDGDVYSDDKGSNYYVRAFLRV